MNTVGLVAVLFGLFIVAARGWLLVAPASALRIFSSVIKTETRTRIAGIFVLLLAGVLIWAGSSGNSSLASFLLVVGLFIAVIGVSALVLFPRAYMGVAEALLPEDVSGGLLGWRLLGAIGALIGGVICYFGLQAL